MPFLEEMDINHMSNTIKDRIEYVDVPTWERLSLQDDWIDAHKYATMSDIKNYEMGKIGNTRYRVIKPK